MIVQSMRYDAKMAEAPKQKALDFPKIVFPRPTAYGWYTVVFPHIHDQNMLLDLWVDQVLAWCRAHSIQGYYWLFERGTKKDGDRMSPVFFFRERLDAKRIEWRFSGETIEKEQAAQPVYRQ
jgi:hypothetical protein